MTEEKIKIGNITDSLKWTKVEHNIYDYTDKYGEEQVGYIKIYQLNNLFVALLKNVPFNFDNETVKTTDAFATTNKPSIPVNTLMSGVDVGVGLDGLFVANDMFNELTGVNSVDGQIFWVTLE